MNNENSKTSAISSQRSEGGYTVGQEIAFNVGYGSGTWEIEKIEKITPSGRLICGHRTLNPGLSIRGGGGFGQPYRGHIVTDKIRKQYQRQQLVTYFRTLEYDALPLKTLKKLKAQMDETV